MQGLGYALDTTWRLLLRDLGIAPADVLRRAGLPDDLLQQPSVRLAPEDYYRLWDSVEVETGDPAFPVTLCQAIRSESFSPPLFAALCSPNLLIAAQRIARYKPLVAPIRFHVTQQRHTVTIELAWPSSSLPPPASLVLMELLFCVTIARLGTRENIRPIQVTATALPSPVGPYEKFLGARIHRSRRNQVIFPKAKLCAPF